MAVTLHDQVTFVAFCTSGLEGAVAFELRKYNFKVTYSSSGRIFFLGTLGDVPFLNMKIKSADRISILISQFQADTFDELFDNVKSSNIVDFLEPHAKVTIEKMKITNSKLSATGAVASVLKKALVESIGGTDETGSEYRFILIIKNDMVYLLLDTTGEDGLNKRGYRTRSGRAPLRETIAASVIILSKWNEDIELFDPFCGSGTIPIEAATMDLPNSNRTFSSEKWPILKDRWQELKKEYNQLWQMRQRQAIIELAGDKKIHGYDRDCNIVRVAKENAKRASAQIDFSCIDFEDLSVNTKRSYVISNLPYGERMEDDIIGQIPILREKFPNACYYLLHPSEKFEQYFGRADKKVRFQNGGIWTFLYMYYKHVM